jgi:hypothetical protein
VTGSSLAPETVHRRLLDGAIPRLGFAPERPLPPQREALAAKLAELLACPEAGGDLDLRVEAEARGDGFVERRLVFTSEPGAEVPCHLLVPEGAAGPVPVVSASRSHERDARLARPSRRRQRP